MARKTGTNERYIREWLAAQAGEKRIREVVEEGGFQQFRRVAETPFNLVYEARPQ